MTHTANDFSYTIVPNPKDPQRPNVHITEAMPMHRRTLTDEELALLEDSILDHDRSASE